MSSKKETAKPKEVDFNALLQAVKSCLIDITGIRTSTRTYGVDKSTLQQHKLKITAKFGNISEVSEVVEVSTYIAYENPSENGLLFCVFNSLFDGAFYI